MQKIKTHEELMVFLKDKRDDYDIHITKDGYEVTLKSDPKVVGKK